MILQVFQAFSWVFQPLSCWSLEVKTLPPEPAKEKEEPKEASNWFSWRHGNGRETAELKNGKNGKGFSFFFGFLKKYTQLPTPMFLVWSRNPFQHDFYKAGGRLDPLFYESGCKMWYTPRNFHADIWKWRHCFRSRSHIHLPAGSIFMRGEDSSFQGELTELEMRWELEGTDICWSLLIDKFDKYLSGWWFQLFFMFTPTWGNDPFWLILFNWVETTN